MIGKLVGALIGRKVKEKIADAVLDKVDLPPAVENAIKVVAIGDTEELLSNLAGKAGADQESVVGTIVKKTGKKK